jgi:hypothetical protein
MFLVPAGGEIETSYTFSQFQEEFQKFGGAGK